MGLNDFFNSIKHGDVKGAGGGSSWLGKIGHGAKSGADWLGETPSAGGSSDVVDPDRANFDLPGSEQRALELNAAAFRAENRKPGQAVGSTAAGAQAQDSSFRAQQSQALERLGLLASGQDSLALPQFQRANNQNIAQQRSLAASASPGNSAAMARLAAQNIGRMGTGFGSRAAELGIQERNAATNALGMLAAQARGQDQSLNQFNAGARQQNQQFNAGQSQQNSQFNVNAGLQQTGLNDRAAADARELELRNAGMIQAGTMGYEQNNTSRYGIDKGVPVGPSNLERIGGVAAGLAPFLASDERTKTNVGALGGDELDQLIGRLRPRSFEYRGGVEPMSGQPDGGPRLGVMAQDVEAGGPAGRAMVQDVGGVKAIDTGKATGTALALLGRLGERLDALEGATAARTKQTTRNKATDAAPAPERVRPEELSRELKRTTRPEELQRERVDVPTGYRPLPAPRMAR
jgi:hypothetical protein